MATNACGTYFGSDLIGTDVRHSFPISPMSEPSRETTSDDCGGWMRRQGSWLSGSCESAEGAESAKSAVTTTTRLVITVDRYMDRKNTPKGPEWYQRGRSAACDRRHQSPG